VGLFVKIFYIVLTKEVRTPFQLLVTPDPVKGHMSSIRYAW